MVGGAVTGRIERVPGTGASNVIATVQEAMAQAPQGGPRRAGASLSILPTGLESIWVLFVFYLCFASLRAQEIISALAIPKLPMVTSIILFVWMLLATPLSLWATLWREMFQARCQAVIFVCALMTVPLGIWMSNSLGLVYPPYVLSMVVFALGLLLMRDPRMRVRILATLTLTLGLITTLTVHLGIGATTVGDSGRLAIGVSLDPNDFAWVLATFVPISLWLATRMRPIAPFWWGMAALLALAIVPTQSRGGLIALASGMLVLMLFGATGWRRIIVLLGVAALTIGVFVYIGQSGASRLTDVSGYSGGTGRTELWANGMKWIIQRPWGYGMGNFSTYNVWVTGNGLSGHNAFVNVFVELGVVAGTAFAVMWIGTLRGLRRARTVAVEAGDRIMSTEAGYLLAALTANLVGAQFINVQYSGLMLLMLATGAAAAHSARAAHTQPTLTPATFVSPTSPRDRQRPPIRGTNR